MRVLNNGDELTVAKVKFARAEKVSGTFTLKKGKNPYVLIPCTLDPEAESTFKARLGQFFPVISVYLSVSLGDFRG